MQLLNTRSIWLSQKRSLSKNRAPFCLSAELKGITVISYFYNTPKQRSEPESTLNFHIAHEENSPVIYSIKNDFINL